jgi:hypothetical protein
MPYDLIYFRSSSSLDVRIEYHSQDKCVNNGCRLRDIEVREEAISDPRSLRLTVSMPAKTPYPCQMMCLSAEGDHLPMYPVKATAFIKSSSVSLSA